MATQIIGYGAILNAPTVRDRVSEPLSSRLEERLPVNVLEARYLELHERGNLFWWRQSRAYESKEPRAGATELATRVLNTYLGWRIKQEGKRGRRG